MIGNVGAGLPDAYIVEQATADQRPHGLRRHRQSIHTIANGFGPALSAGDPKDAIAICECPFHEINMNVMWADPMGVAGLTAILGWSNVSKTLGSYDTSLSWYQSGPKNYGAPPPRMVTLTLRYNF